MQSNVRDLKILKEDMTVYEKNDKNPLIWNYSWLRAVCDRHIARNREKRQENIQYKAAQKTKSGLEPNIHNLLKANHASLDSATPAPSGNVQVDVNIKSEPSKPLAANAAITRGRSTVRSSSRQKYKSSRSPKDTGKSKSKSKSQSRSPSLNGMFICKHFYATGSCPFDPNNEGKCKYQHVRPKSKSPSAGSRGGKPKTHKDKSKTTLCKQYLKGNCARGAGCKYLHHVLNASAAALAEYHLAQSTATPAPSGTASKRANSPNKSDSGSSRSASRDSQKSSGSKTKSQGFP